MKVKNYLWLTAVTGAKIVENHKRQLDCKDYSLHLLISHVNYMFKIIL